MDLEIVKGVPADVVPVKVEVAAEPLVIDAREAARLLGIGRTTFLKLHAAGKTPLPVRFGRAVRWRLDELKEWLKAGTPTRDKWLKLKDLPGRHA